MVPLTLEMTFATEFGQIRVCEPCQELGLRIRLPCGDMRLYEKSEGRALTMAKSCRSMKYPLRSGMHTFADLLLGDLNSTLSISIDDIFTRASSSRLLQ